MPAKLFLANTRERYFTLRLRMLLSAPFYFVIISPRNSQQHHGEQDGWS